MDSNTLVAIVSIATAGLTIGHRLHVPRARRGSGGRYRADFAGTAT